MAESVRLNRLDFIDVQISIFEEKNIHNVIVFFFMLERKLTVL